MQKLYLFVHSFICLNVALRRTEEYFNHTMTIRLNAGGKTEKGLGEGDRRLLQIHVREYTRHSCNSCSSAVYEM